MTQADDQFLKERCGIAVHATVVVGEKGQVVIPKAARDQLGIHPGDSLLCMIKGDLALGLAKSEALKKLPPCEEHDVKYHASVAVGERGQVVIPKAVRDAIGIRPGDTLMTVVKLGAVVGMVKVTDVGRMIDYMRREVEDSGGKPLAAAKK